MANELKPPIPPMEARLVSELPVGGDWQYEPKWDGFRCIAFRDGSDIYLQSKSGQPLARYFPDIVAALQAVSVPQFVLDGEIVIPVSGRLSFDDLLLRVHPAASRVRKLASEFPAMLIVFDLLGNERGESLLGMNLSERRTRLEEFAKKYLPSKSDLRLSPATTKIEQSKKWFKSFGGNLDGIIAKHRDMPYQSGERDGMQKYKKKRTADCVVGGFRYASKKRVVGSLLLGLYDDEGKLNHVGFTSSFSADDRKKITALVKPLIGPPGFTGRAPGGPSRWSTRRSDQWKPLQTKLVVEVEYDHFTGGRFRHGTKFLRWRPDKAPRQCKLDQVARRTGRVAFLKRKAS